ncbi:hypothetical protein GCM10025776_37740 [Corallincola platygyrae]
MTTDAVTNRIAFWSEKLELRLKHLEAYKWGADVSILQLLDSQERVFGEIYIDLSHPKTKLGIGRLRYPVAGYQAGAMLIKGQKSPLAKVRLSSLDSAILQALQGILHHPEYPGFTASAYPDLQGLENKILKAISEQRQPTRHPHLWLRQVLSAKLALAYHQNDLSQGSFEKLTIKLIGDNLDAIGTPPAQIPYAMSNLASPGVFSYRELWQKAIAQQVSARYHAGELELDTLLSELNRLRGPQAKQTLKRLTGFEVGSKRYGVELAKKFISSLYPDLPEKSE